MRSLFILLTLVLTISAQAQNDTNPNISSHKKIKVHLSAPAQRDSLTVVHETVQITEHGDAAAIVTNNLGSSTKAVSGYRIVIFMSNSQSARRDAIAAQESFAALFPEEHSYLSYENPYFKVAVGNCTSQEEAITLLGRLRGTFPKAFIMRETIAIGEFAR
jgi:hypothetical protein